MDNELLADFLTEAKDLLEETDNHLILLEKQPDDENLLNAVFRGYHTIKGSAGFLELQGLVRLCHALETLFDSLRLKTVQMNPVIMNASLEASNSISHCMSMLAVNPDAHFEPDPHLVERLLHLATGSLPEHLDASAVSPLLTVSLEEDSPVLADSTPVPDSLSVLENSPSEEYWRQLHQVFYQPDQVPMTKSVTFSAEPAPQSPTPSSVPSVHVALPTSNAFNAAPGASFKPEKETQIKVDTNRLDAVLTLASEVGLAKNRVGAAKARILSKNFTEQALADLERSFNDLDRLTSSLQNAVMLTRMQPIGRLFSRYPRIVRDLARTLEKDIDIEILGQDTEIDKGMIEDLADPLVHLIRNSADHGIETPAVRQRAGKHPQGRIVLKAQQEGDRILISISDDGKGIDPSMIRQKAKSKGILDPAIIDAMSDRQALDIIFMPGFSTAETLSSVSGRGVGMDVVKTNITKMGGEITIDSTPGTGTLMEIRLPLTLAVLPALILTADQQPLALPLGAVQEILSLEEHPPQKAGGQPVINLRGEILSVLDLSELLGWGPSASAPVAALVDLGSGRRVALKADGFIGREEVMVKSLDGIKPKGVSGVMVDAQGEIVLILDLKEILSSHFQSNQEH